MIAIRSAVPLRRPGRVLHACTLAALLALCLPGCSILNANLSDQSSAKQFRDIDIHSAYPTISRENIEQINLLELIDPGQKAKEQYSALWPESETRDGMGTNQKYGPRYDLALSWFRQNGMPQEEKRLTRNGIQERMLSASISRCNVFKTFLRRNQSDMNFYLGTATTVAGVLGAVLPGVNASRNLAGTAGIFSGIQAEYNQSYFSNLTAEVLIKGIELRQSMVQEQLRVVGQKQSIADYPLEAAIRDAIYFDGLCSTVVGLEQAAESINHEKNPGIQQGLRTIVSIKAMNEIANVEKLSDIQSSGKLDKLLARVAQSSAPLAAIPTTTVPADISEMFFSLESAILGYLHDRVSTTRESYRQKYEALLAQDKVPDESKKKIASPDSILKNFETMAKSNFTNKLNTGNCWNDIPGLVSTLATKRRELQEATTEDKRIEKSAEVDVAITNISIKRRKLQKIIDLAKYEIDAAIDKSRKAKDWNSAKTFLDLVLTDDAGWVKTTGEILDKPACPQEASAPPEATIGNDGSAKISTLHM